MSNPTTTRQLTDKTPHYSDKGGDQLQAEVRCCSSIELEAWCWSLAAQLHESYDRSDRAFLAVRLEAVKAEIAFRERMSDPVTPLRSASRHYDLERIRADFPLSDALPRLASVELRSVAGRFSGRCPFPDHHDRSPSLSVRGDGQVWHCFGCGRGGDLFTFAQQWYDTRSFLAAVEIVLSGLGASADAYRIGGRPVRQGSAHVA